MKFIFMIILSLLTIGKVYSQTNKAPSPEIRKTRDFILIKVEIKNEIAVGNYRIPFYPNSFLEIREDLFDYKKYGIFRISLNDVRSIDEYPNPNMRSRMLPGGRKIPIPFGDGVGNGLLPSSIIQTNLLENEAYVYQNRYNFGVFIPSDTGFDNMIITTRYYYHREYVGDYSIVGIDESGSNSGELLMLDLNFILH